MILSNSLHTKMVTLAPMAALNLISRHTLLVYLGLSLSPSASPLGTLFHMNRVQFLLCP